jgi:hypothetical protein
MGVLSVFREAYDFAMSASGNGPIPGADSPLRMREAAGATIDADESSWKRLTGNPHKDLDPVKQGRAAELAQHLWESNPLANRLVELPLAYLLGKGVRIRSADDDAQKVLDRHWRDSINAWPIKLTKRIRELSLFGEQCWPVFVGDNGFVRVGYLDPKLIATVVMDPDNAEQPIGVVTRKDAHGRSRRYRVIVNGPESVFTPRTQEIRATFDTGDCFLYRINDLCNGTRGRGDLLPLLDWLDAYDEFLFGELDRADFMRAFVWDVEITGADQKAVDERAGKITAPKPGTVRVHNENEKWKAEAPQLQAADGSIAARLFRNQILGGITMPEHWYGGAADVNRATGESMAEPTEKAFEMRQAYLGHMLVEVATFVLRADWQVLESDDELEEARQEVIDGLQVEWPEMTTKDTTRYAAALQQVIGATAQAIREQLLTRETALNLIAALARQLGVEIDVDEELANAETEAAERGDSDLFDDPLEDPPPPKVPLPQDADA